MGGFTHRVGDLHALDLDRAFFGKGPLLASLINPSRYRPALALDGLLRSIRLSGVLPAKAFLSQPYGVDLAYDADTLAFYQATEGQCFVRMEGFAEPIAFEAGDVLIIPRNIRHSLENPLGTVLVSVRELLSAQIEPHFLDEHGSPSLSNFLSHEVRHGGGGDIFALRMFIVFVDENAPSAMLSNLSSPIFLKGFGERRKSFLENVFDEFETQRGSDFLAQPIYIRLAETVFSIALKEAATIEPGNMLYKGLSDSAVAHIVSLIMLGPDKRWDMQSIARVGGLSRSALNIRFHAAMGMSPGQFITHVRMLRANDLLANTSLSLAQIAEKSGYSSEAAFNRGYRKWSGTTPGKVRALYWQNDDPTACRVQLTSS
jgi:AraC family transcriptional regulator, alkane utilization regulator